MLQRWLKSNRGFLLFLCCLGLFRTAVADWNPIPSGSMRPNLLEGDVVLVNRLAYDLKLPLTDVVLAHLGEPQRGDVVTFSSPRDGTRLIKRVIGLPGDRVELRGQRLYINGEAADYGQPAAVMESGDRGHPLPALRVSERQSGHERIIQWMEQPMHQDFAPVIVPPGQYLMLGDNRDNSADSRYFGFVPRERLIGHAHHILLSADILDSWRPRFERFGQAL